MNDKMNFRINLEKNFHLIMEIIRFKLCFIHNKAD